MDTQPNTEVAAQADTPLLLSEKAPLPLAVVPPALHTRKLQLLNALYFAQLVAINTNFSLRQAQLSLPPLVLGLFLGTAYTQWAKRRASQKRAARALEEGWTVADHAEKDKEEMDKANKARGKIVWLFVVFNVVMAGMVGTLAYAKFVRA